MYSNKQKDIRLKSNSQHSKDKCLFQKDSYFRFEDRIYQVTKVLSEKRVSAKLIKGSGIRTGDFYTRHLTKIQKKVICSVCGEDWNKEDFQGCDCEENELIIKYNVE